MGDPPPGLNVRGAFFGRKSDKEVCGGVVSVVSESSSRRRRAASTRIYLHLSIDWLAEEYRKAMESLHAPVEVVR